MVTWEQEDTHVASERRNEERQWEAEAERDDLILRAKEDQWELLPLEGKYYGTKLRSADGAVITIWAPNYANFHASDREIANGWEPDDGADHVEDTRSLAIARLIVAGGDLVAAAEAVANAMYVFRHCAWCQPPNEKGGVQHTSTCWMPALEAALEKARAS